MKFANCSIMPAVGAFGIVIALAIGALLVEKPAMAQPSGSVQSATAAWNPDVYHADLQRRLKKHWFPPRGVEFKSVIVLFKVHAQGELSDLRIGQSSGVAMVDNAALRAVEEAAPFRPLPAGAPENVDIKFEFPTSAWLGGSGSVVDLNAPNRTTPGGLRQVLSDSDRDDILRELSSQLKPYECVYQAGESKIHQMWDGKHMRIETDVAGQGITIIFDFPSKMVISLIDSQRKYFKKPMTAGLVNSNLRKQTLSTEQRQAPSAKQLGAKFVNGHPCHGYEYTHDNVVTTAWTGDDTQNMIVLFEQSAPTGKAVTMTLKSYREGAPLEDPLKIPDSYSEMKVPATE